MRKFFVAFLLFLTLAFSPLTPSLLNPPKASATLPVVDVSAIAQLVTQVKQMLSLLGLSGDILDTGCETWGAATQSILGNFGLGSWNSNMDSLISYLGVGDIFGGAGQSGTLKTGGLAGGALQGIYTAEDLMISVMKLFGVGLSNGQYTTLKNIGFLIPEAIYGNAVAGSKCQPADSGSGGSGSGGGTINDAAKSIISSVCGGNLNALTSKASSVWNAASSGNINDIANTAKNLANDQDVNKAISTSQTIYRSINQGTVFSVQSIDMMQSIISQYGLNLSTNQIQGLVQCGAIDANAVLAKYQAPAPSAEPTIGTPLPANCARYTNNGGCMRTSTSVPQGKNNSLDLDTDPSTFILRVYTIILGFAGAIALLLILNSGWKILLSKGRPEAIQQGKEQLTAAIVGLLFIILAFVLFDLLAVDLLHIPGICNDKTKNCVQFNNPYSVTPANISGAQGTQAQPTIDMAKCMAACNSNRDAIVKKCNDDALTSCRQRYPNIDEQNIVFKTCFDVGLQSCTNNNKPCSDVCNEVHGGSRNYCSISSDMCP